MDKMKQYVALTVVGVLGILAAGWFLLVSPKRSEAADLRSQADTETQGLSALQTQLSMLKAQAKTLPQQQAKLAAVAAKIPDNPALPGLIRALTKAADEADVELVSVAPAAPAPVAAPGAAAATGTVAPAPAAAAPVGGATAAAAGGALPAAGTAGAAPTGATTATAGTLQQIVLSINVVGGYFQVEQFFDRLENLTRALKVTGATLAPGTDPSKPAGTGGAAAAVNDGRVLAGSITANVYMASGRVTAAPAAPVAK